MSHDDGAEPSALSLEGADDAEMGGVHVADALRVDRWEEAVELLAELVDPDDCRLDHDDYCQTHYSEVLCANQRARNLLGWFAHNPDAETVADEPVGDAHAALPEAIAAVALTIGPDDVLVVTVPDGITRQQAAAIRDIVHGALPDVPTFVTVESVSATVARPDALAEHHSPEESPAWPADELDACELEVEQLRAEIARLRATDWGPQLIQDPDGDGGWNFYVQLVTEWAGVEDFALTDPPLVAALTEYRRNLAAPGLALFTEED